MRPAAAFALLAFATAARAETVAPVGDGGSVGITLQNQSVHPLATRLGPPGDDGLELTLARYGTGTWVAQCIDGDAGHPGLVLTVDRDHEPVEVPPIAFPDGPPVLWIAAAPTGRAALQHTVQSAAPQANVRHLSPAEVPAGFAALRFAPMILVSAADYAALAPERRAALRDAVAAGVTLVVATGEAGAEPDALADLAAVTLGPVHRPTGVLAAHLPLATSTRPIVAGEGVATLLTADGAPLVVEAPLGLGRVRVVAVPFGELAPGPVAAAALSPAPEPLAHVLRWLDGAPPPASGDAAILGAHTWILLGVLLLIGLIARRRPRVALALAVPWWITALALPPQFTATRLDAARVLYVPFGAGALAVGTLDLTLARGGARTLPAGTARVALEDARPGGACLIEHPGAAAWIVDGPPASPRRIVFFAVVDRVPDGDDKIGALPDWPDGLLAGATLRRVGRPDGLPIALAPDRVDAMRVEVRPPTAHAPDALPPLE